jgi:hypothetical protein
MFMYWHKTTGQNLIKVGNKLVWFVILMVVEYEDGSSGLWNCVDWYEFTSDGGYTDLWNTGILIPVYMVLQPRR